MSEILIFFYLRERFYLEDSLILIHSCTDVNLMQIPKVFLMHSIFRFSSSKRLAIRRLIRHGHSTMHCWNDSKT